MNADESVIIVDGDGAEHEFPAGFDPKRAASIVRGRGEASFTGPLSDLPSERARHDPTLNAQRIADQASKLPSRLQGPAAMVGTALTDPNLMAAGGLMANAPGFIRGALRYAPNVLTKTGQYLSNNVDLTKPARPIGDLLQWMGKKSPPATPIGRLTGTKAPTLNQSLQEVLESARKTDTVNAPVLRAGGSVRPVGGGSRINRGAVEPEIRGGMVTSAPDKWGVTSIQRLDDAAQLKVRVLMEQGLSEAEAVRMVKGS